MGSVINNIRTNLFKIISKAIRLNETIITHLYMKFVHLKSLITDCEYNIFYLGNIKDNWTNNFA